MLDKHHVRPFTKNLAALVLLALPVAVVGIALQQVARGVAPSVSWIGDMAGVFVVAALPVSIGGVLHQVISLRLPTRWTSRLRRTTAIVLSPTVLLVIVLMLEWSVLFEFWLPTLLGGAVYCALLELPDAGRFKTRAD